MTEPNEIVTVAESCRKPAKSDPGSSDAAAPAVVPPAVVPPAETAGPEEEVRGALVPAFSRRQQAALPVVATCPSVSQAARVLGVSRNTLRHWLDDPDFRNEVARLRQEAADLARQELQGLMLRGASVISEAMDDPNPNIRLRAARYALSFGNEFSELQRLADEMSELQHALAVSLGRPTQR